MKKILSFLLVLIMTATAMLVVVQPIEVSAATMLTENEFVAKMEALQARYPHKQYWNDYNGTETIDGRTTSKAGPIACNGTRTDAAHYGQKCTAVGFCYICTCKCGKFVGEQCYGFANLMAYHTFGSYAISSGSANTSKGWNKSASVSTFYAGDVVRIDGDAHSIFIHKVTDTDVYYVDCNSGVPCQIEWNNKISISSLKSRTTYVVRMSGNTLKGTGDSSINTLTVKYNANGGDIGYPVEIGTNYKVYTTDGSYAIVRSGPGSSYGEVTRFASGTIVTIIETQKKSDYTWGKIKYSKEAWVALGSWMIQMGTAYDHSYYLSSSVVYDSNTSQPVTTTLKYGEELKNGLCNDTTLALYRDGYNFLGWSLTADGSNAIIHQDQAIKPEEIVPEIANGDKTVTMYAIWEKIGCDHNYQYTASDEKWCWQECTICGDTTEKHVHRINTTSQYTETHCWLVCRDCGYLVGYAPHRYSNNCDNTCNSCDYTRTIEHTYNSTYSYNTTTHWKTCTICNNTSTPTAHVYTNNCDASCNTCGYTRSISHSYDSTYMYNSDTHWKTCSICGHKGTTTSHSYSNNCDSSCNTCTYIRTTEHVYDNDCDTKCNTVGCGYTRTIEHTYDNACDTSCNVCNESRLVTHTFDNDCDTTCNKCDFTREPQHQYDTLYDKECNICGEARTIGTTPTETTPEETSPNAPQSGSAGLDQKTITTITIAAAVTVSAISIFGTALVMRRKR